MTVLTVKAQDTATAMEEIVEKLGKDSFIIGTKKIGNEILVKATNSPKKTIHSKQNLNQKFNKMISKELNQSSVSSLGNKLTQAQIDLLNRLETKIIVCPDKDKSGGHLVDIATENNWAVSYPQWDSNIKDTAEAVTKYGRLYTLQSIIKSATLNNAKIQVMKKIGVN